MKETKLFPALRSALRRLWMRSSFRSNAVLAARIEVEGCRHRYEVPCAKCKKMLRMNEVRVDHIEMAGSLTSFSDIEGFVRRLFVGVEGLQCLCDTCHKIKTKEERRKK